MIGRGSDAIHFDLKYQGMEQIYFISKFLLWNSKTLKNYAIKKKRKNPLFCKSPKHGCKLGIFMLKKYIGSYQKGLAGDGCSVKGGKLGAGDDREPGRAAPSLARAQAHGTHRNWAERAWGW